MALCLFGALVISSLFSVKLIRVYTFCCTCPRVLNQSWFSRHLGSGWLAISLWYCNSFSLNLSVGLLRLVCFDLFFFSKMWTFFFSLELILLFCAVIFNCFRLGVGPRVRFGFSLALFAITHISPQKPHMQSSLPALDKLLLKGHWSWRKGCQEGDGPGLGILRNPVLYSHELGHLEVSSCSMKWSKHCPLWNPPHRLPGTNGIPPKANRCSDGEIG